jgi:hypothetical protein
MKYRLYVDEVGNADLDSSDDPNHRFLSLTGVIIELDHVAQTVSPQLDTLKRTFFGAHPDDPIILHRKDIVNRRRPFDVLLDDRVRTDFDRELLRFLQQWDYSVITVFIDKLRHRETYSTWRFHPYHYCLTVMLERYVFFLNRRSAQGDVMAESRGGREDRTLKESFHRLYEHGTDYITPTQIRSALTSGQLKVKPKANNIAGLQLADLLAHPSRNEILSEHQLLHRPPAPFAAQVMRILASKYDRQGPRMFGKKLL